MKYYIACFPLFFLFKLSFSQTYENGYYVTLQNDTMSAKIKVPKDLFGSVQIEVLERKIKVSDGSSQGVKTLKLADIKSYGFSYKDKNFNFASKQLKENKSKFFERLADGKNASCYYYYRSGYRGLKNETFIIEHSDSSKLVLTNSMSKRKKCSSSSLSFR